MAGPLGPDGRRAGGVGRGPTARTPAGSACTRSTRPPDGRSSARRCSTPTRRSARSRSNRACSPGRPTGQGQRQDRPGAGLEGRHRRAVRSCPRTATPPSSSSRSAAREAPATAPNRNCNPHRDRDPLGFTPHATQRGRRDRGNDGRRRPDRPAGSGRVPVPDPAQGLARRRPSPRVSIPATASAPAAPGSTSSPRSPMGSCARRSSWSPAGSRRSRPTGRASPSPRRRPRPRGSRPVHALGQATFYDNGTTAMRLPRGHARRDLRRRRLHRADRQRLRAAASRAASSTCTGRTSSGSAAARRGRARPRSRSRSTDAALAVDSIPVSEPVP